MRCEIVRETLHWGAHAPSRAGFGALAETNFEALRKDKVRDDEGVIASTRGACAPQSEVPTYGPAKAVAPSPGFTAPSAAPGSLPIPMAD